MKKFILGIILLGSLSHTAAAQLNESDSINWQLKFNATGSVLDGNVARTLLLQRFEVAHANTRWGVSSRNDYQYGRTRYILTENDVISYNFVYLHPLSRVYPYFMALVETNYRRNIGFRYQTGPGVSWNGAQEGPRGEVVPHRHVWEYTRYGGNQFDEAVYNGNNIIETWRVTGRVFGKHRLSSALRVSL